MSYKLAIFDLDGTILDTIEDLADSTNFALTACGFPERSKDEVRRFVGNGIRKLIERAVPEGTDIEGIDKVFITFKSHYHDNCSIKTRPYAGILTMLNRLREAGYKSAVLSNKADIMVKALCKLHFDGLFDYISGEKEGVPRKPAPNGINMILRYFNLKVSDCVYIGDSEVDVDTAKNAGMDFVGVDWGLRDRAELVARGGENIAHTAEELAAFIIG